MNLNVSYNARFQLLLTSMEIHNLGTGNVLCNILFLVNFNHSLKKSQLETKCVGNKRGAYNYKKCLCVSLVLLKNEKKKEKVTNFKKSLFSLWILEKAG